MPENNKQEQEVITHNRPKKRLHPLLIIMLVFVIFWLIVLMTQKKEPISWIENYQAGIELSKEEDKPLLLVFYKPNAPMYNDAKNNTYNNPDVKIFVESNFIPVLINVDKHSDIAKKYRINYYPTIYVKEPDRDEKFGPRVGYDPPALFISEMQNLLDQLKKSQE